MMSQLEITSQAFKHRESIPVKYTCEGEEVNPSLVVRSVPLKTESLALVMSDPDAPGGTWIHWVMWNLNPNGHKISENSAPGVEGKNSAGQIGYQGPCPPSGTHRYIFEVFALDSKIDLEEGAIKDELEKAIKGRILASGSLTGLYEKSG